MKLKSSLLAGCTVVLPLLASSAFAQQTGGQPAGGGIEEITVTALRHAQSIMTVPAAIQATTIQQLNNQGIHNLTDIELVTPGYSVVDSSGYTQIFIRGIGNNNFVGPDNSVATYVDDVPRPSSQFMNQFVDVSRVEVLKGAQGGLYGRNATGGVVNVITEQPSTDAFYGHGRVSYGEFDTIDAGAFVNMPVTDTLAVSLAAEHDSHSAYIKNIAIKNPYSAANFSAPISTTPGNPFNGVPGTLLPLAAPALAASCPGGQGVYCTPAQSAAIMNSGVNPHSLDTQNTYGLDSKVLWQPLSDFKVTWAGDYFFKDDSGGNQNYSATPAVPQAYLPFGFSALAAPLPAAAGPIAGASIIPAADLAHLPTQQTVSRKFETATGDNLTQELHDWGTSATAVWNSPIADITSITAYRGNHSILDADLCACSVPAGTAVVKIKRQFYYQEVRAVSTTDGPIHWLGGFTFLDNKQTFDTQFVVSPIIDVHTAHAYQLVQNWTVYGQAGYDITSDLNFTASLRWEHETNHTRFPSIPDGCTPGLPPTGNCTQQPGAGQEQLDKLIPSATLSYALGDGTAYVRWAHGVNTGGVNPVASVGIFDAVHAPLSDGSVFGPEKVDTYEAGYKQSLLDHRLQLTGDIFYNKFNGLQESAHAAPAYQQALILAFVNAGSARSYGAEGSASWQVIDPLTLGLNVGYLDAAFSNFSYGYNGPFLVPTNLNHSEMPNAPKWQLSMTADLDQPLDDRFNLVGHIVESHLSSQLGDQSVGAPYGFPIPPAIVPGYWLTNLKLGVKTNDDAYELSVFANNLFDQQYYTFGSVSAELGDLFSLGNPRIVGAEFDVNF